jgi:hypothetical protein
MATRTWVGTTDTNWGTTTNWLEAAVPTSADDVVMTVVVLNNITLNTSARVCKSIDFTNFGSRTFTMTNTLTVSGNVKFISAMTIAGSSTLTINAAATLTSAGITFPNALTLSSAVTYTFADNWVVTGLFSSGNPSVYNGNTITCNGGMAVIATSGTTSFILGGGTWTSSGNNFTNNLEIAGNITISGTVRYATGTFKYTSGTISGSSTPILNFIAATTAITLNSLFTFAGTITLTTGQTFGGTSGFTITTLNAPLAGTVQTHILKFGNTYTVTGSLILGTSPLLVTLRQLTFKSDTPGSKVVFNLNQGATQTVEQVLATDINSSGGQTIWNFRGTNTTCSNWNLLTSPPPQQISISIN